MMSGIGRAPAGGATPGYKFMICSFKSDPGGPGPRQLRLSFMDHKFEETQGQSRSKSRLKRNPATKNVTTPQAHAQPSDKPNDC
jgi:hypothetical protein